MHHQQNETTETAFFHQFADMMTGGTYGIVRWIWAIIFNINVMLLMVFLRKNMGSKIAANGSWLFASTWLVFLFCCSILTPNPHPETGIDATMSTGLIMYHGLLYFILSTWRKFGAWWNMRNAGKEGVRTRHSMEIGDSVIYPLIHRLLEPLGLVDDEVNPQTIWKMTQARWMQFCEPFLFFLLGFFFMGFGYGVYGKFLMLASVCLFIATFRTYNNMARVRQAQKEAEILGRLSNPDTTSGPTKPHVID